MKIYISATMRSGNSLLSNILSAHDEIVILMESIHFFRMFYNFYNPLEKNKKNLELILHHCYLHLKYRKDIILDIDKTKKILTNKEINYANVYDAIATTLLAKTNKSFWGENCANYWRKIPKFIDMFEDAKTIHAIRDPRAVFSSWKKLSSIPNNANLNCIFNWIDSSNYMKKFKNELNSSQYHAVRYEDIMSNTEETLHNLFSYLGVKFDDDILDQSKWVEKIEKNNGLVKTPRSAHEGKNIVGFSSKRISNWENHLEEWEIFLIEFLCQNNMKELGYELRNVNFDESILKEILKRVCSNDMIAERLVHLLKTDEGTDRYPLNPRDPMSWGAKHDASKWFSETENGQAYFAEKKAIDERLEKEY